MHATKIMLLGQCSNRQKIAEARPKKESDSKNLNPNAILTRLSLFLFQGHWQTRLPVPGLRVRGPQALP